MSLPLRIAVDTSAPPLAMEFAPRGSAVYLRLTNEYASRTVEVEDGVLVDYDASENLVGFEIIGVDSADFAGILTRLKERFASRAPELAAVEAVDD